MKKTSLAVRILAGILAGVMILLSITAVLIYFI